MRSRTVTIAVEELVTCEALGPCEALGAREACPACAPRGALRVREAPAAAKRGVGRNRTPPAGCFSGLRLVLRRLLRPLWDNSRMTKRLSWLLVAIAALCAALAGFWLARELDGAAPP